MTAMRHSPRLNWGRVFSDTLITHNALSKCKVSNEKRGESAYVCEENKERQTNESITHEGKSKKKKSNHK